VYRGPGVYRGPPEVYRGPCMKNMRWNQTITYTNVDISRHSNGHIFRYWVTLQSHGFIRW